MKKTNQFLPGISTQLQGREKRRQLEAHRILPKKLLTRSITDIGVLFGRILPADLLEQAQNAIRKRIYPEVVTFWTWISQLPGCNMSCSSAVSFVQNWYAGAELSIPAVYTSPRAEFTEIPHREHYRAVA